MMVLDKRASGDISCGSTDSTIDIWTQTLVHDLCIETDKLCSSPLYDTILRNHPQMF